MDSSTKRQFKRRQSLHQNQKTPNSFYAQTFQEQTNNQVSIYEKTPGINQNNQNLSNKLPNKPSKSTCSEKQINYRNQKLSCKKCGKSLR